MGTAKEFHFDPKVYKILNDYQNGLNDKQDAIKKVSNVIYRCPSYNLLIGKIDPEESEFNSIGFLARQYNGTMTFNPFLMDDIVNDGRVNTEKIEEEYHHMLRDKACYLGVDTSNADLALFFKMNTNVGKRIARFVKWNKNKIALSRLFTCNGFEEACSDYQTHVLSLTDMIDLKTIVRNIDGTIGLPYIDEYYDSF